MRQPSSVIGEKQQLSVKDGTPLHALLADNGCPLADNGQRPSLSDQSSALRDFSTAMNTDGLGLI
ncbi:MAG: hypothetical protein H0W83_14035 [Planctomycetes bacterium]|nr:hypothetical protein [Planctomycetota bacterium]